MITSRAGALAPDDRLRLALQCGRRGRAAEVRRDLESALSKYSEGRSLLVGLEPTPLLANLLRWSGSALRDLGHVERAERLYSESQEVAETIGSKAALASVLNCRGAIAQRRGDMPGAVSRYRRAACVAAEAGELRLAGMIEQNLGVLANIRGDLDGALVRYRSALRAFLETSDEEAVSWVLNNMGMLLTDMESLRESREVVQAGAGDRGQSSRSHHGGHPERELFGVPHRDAAVGTLPSGA